MKKDPEEAGYSLLEELMAAFEDKYVDRLTYIAAMEIAGLGEKVTSLTDALASITRERDEAREENERLTALFASDGGRLGEIVHLRKEVATRTRERDAMREALKPFAEIVECGCTFTEGDLRGEHDGEDWFRNDGCALKIGHFRRAAALVNGEGG